MVSPTEEAKKKSLIFRNSNTNPKKMAERRKLERRKLVEWDDQGRVIKDWDGRGRRITDWRGYKNHLWPRNLTALRFLVPIYPGKDCTMDQWLAYNEAFDVYEAKVEERWQELQRTPYYREKSGPNSTVSLTNPLTVRDLNIYHAQDRESRPVGTGLLYLQ